MVVAGTHQHLIATAVMVVVGVRAEYRGTLNLEVLILHIINLVGFSFFSLCMHLFNVHTYCYAVLVSGLPSSASWQDLKVRMTWIYR